MAAEIKFPNGISEIRLIEYGHPVTDDENSCLPTCLPRDKDFGFKCCFLRLLLNTELILDAHSKFDFNIAYYWQLRGFMKFLIV